MSTKLPTTGQQITDGKNWGQIINSILTNVTTAREGAGSVTGIPGLYSAIATSQSLTEAALKLNGPGGAIILDDAGQKRISWNDGGGNFNLRGGNYVKANVVTYAKGATEANGGAALVSLASDGADGVVTLAVAPIGAPDTAVTWANSLNLNKTDLTTPGNLVVGGNITGPTITDLYAKVAAGAGGFKLENDKWLTSTDGKSRFYFSTNGQTHFGTQAGYHWRDKTDVANLMALDPAGNLVVKGQISAQGNAATPSIPTAVATAAQAALQLIAPAGQAAYISFHKPGSFASNFGLDGDNNFAFGGWSAGNNYIGVKTGFLMANRLDKLADTAGAVQNLGQFGGNVGNNQRLEIYNQRQADGADWTKTSLILGKFVDATPMNYIAFLNGSTQIAGSADVDIQAQLIVGGAIKTINNITPAGGAIRLTPNLHLNSGPGNTVYLNYDSGAQANKAAAALLVCNGEGANLMAVNYAGDLSTGYLTSNKLAKDSTYQFVVASPGGTIVPTGANLAGNAPAAHWDGTYAWTHLGAWNDTAAANGLGQPILVHRALVSDLANSLSAAGIAQVKAATGGGADNLGNHTATTTLNMNGQAVNGVAEINLLNAASVKSAGRLHIYAEENMYLLAKGPVIVSNAWAGTSGDLIVDRNFYTGGFAQIGVGTQGSKVTVAHAGPASVAAANWGNAHMELRGTAADQSVNISFHRPGAYGANFGLDADGQFSTAGWSGNQAGFTGLKTGYVTSSPLVSAGNQLVGANVNGTIVPTGMIFGGLNAAAAHWNGTYAWKFLGSWTDASDGQAILVHRAAFADQANSLSAGAIGELDNRYAPRAGAVSAGDNLGNHTATTNLNMNNQNIANAANINANGDITAGNSVVVKNGSLLLGTSSTMMWGFNGSGSAASISYSAGGNGGTIGLNSAVFIPRSLTVAGGIAITGTTSGSYLSAAGRSIVDGNGNLVTSSDIRLKENVETLATGLDIISKLRGVTYNWKDAKFGAKKQYGVIAQEIEKVMPELISEDDLSGQTTKAVNYIGIIAPLIEAVKELKTQVDALKAEIATLKK